MKRRNVHIVVYQEDDQVVAQCLDVDVASCGATREEALANIREALDLYFEDAERHDIPRIHRATIVTKRLNYA